MNTAAPRLASVPTLADASTVVRRWTQRGVPLYERFADLADALGERVGPDHDRMRAPGQDPALDFLGAVEPEPQAGTAVREFGEGLAGMAMSAWTARRSDWPVGARRKRRGPVVLDTGQVVGVHQPFSPVTMRLEPPSLRPVNEAVQGSQDHERCASPALGATALAAGPARPRGASRCRPGERPAHADPVGAPSAGTNAKEPDPWAHRCHSPTMSSDCCRRGNGD